MHHSTPSLRHSFPLALLGAAGLALGAAGLALGAAGCGSDTSSPPPAAGTASAGTAPTAAITSVAPGLSAEQAAAALLDPAAGTISSSALPNPVAAQPSEDAPERGSAGVTADIPLSRQGIFARRPSELPAARLAAWAGLYTDKDVLAKLPVESKRLMAEAGKAFLQRDFADALERAYALLEAQPEFPPALLLLGATYYKLRRYEDSVVAHERFLAQAPEQVGTTQALGHCYYGLGQYEKALAHYEKVVELNASSPEALRGLALSKLRIGDLDGALAGLRRVLQLAPDHAEAQSFLAQVLYDQGNSADALSAAQRARELAPSDPRPRYLIAQCLHELGEEEAATEAEAQWKEAAAAAEEVRSIENRLVYRPPDAYALALRLTEIHTQRKDVAPLCEALDLVAKLRPSRVPEVDVRILALDALERCGNRPAAMRAAEVLEKSCGEDVRAWQRLERWYQASGDPKGQVRAGEMWRRLNNPDSR
jgi:tetratricopeptide (TPR) repeat protein